MNGLYCINNTKNNHQIDSFFCHKQKSKKTKAYSLFINLLSYLKKITNQTKILRNVIKSKNNAVLSLCFNKKTYYFGGINAILVTTNNNACTVLLKKIEYLLVDRILKYKLLQPKKLHCFHIQIALKVNAYFKSLSSFIKPELIFKLFASK